MAQGYILTQISLISQIFYSDTIVVHECTTDLRNLRNLRGKNIQRGYPHADLAYLADFLFRYYYVVHECTTDLRNLRNLRGEK